jgi:hypothetical protein
MHPTANTRAFIRETPAIHSMCAAGDAERYAASFGKVEMNTASLKLLVSVVAMLLLNSVSICQTAQTLDWQKMDADGLFTFRLPQGFTKTGMTGVEHYLGEYYKGKTRFLFIYGDTNSNAYDVRREPEMEEYQESETTIDSKQANIRTYSLIQNGGRIYRVELNIGDWANAEVELYMEVESKNPADLEMAREIFNSIDFP